MTTHQSYAIRIDPVGATAALIHAIGRQSITSQNDVNNDVDAGSPYPQCVTINGQKNEASATTRDIGNALTLIGTEGVALETNGAEFWQLELDPLTGLHKSTAVHNVLQIKRGKIVPGRLSIEHQRDATLDLMVKATKDPTTDDTAANLPIVLLASQALPTGLAGDERFTLASATVAGFDFDCNLRIEIDFGIGIKTEGCNSNIHDSEIVVAEVKPNVIISGKNVARFAASIGLLGAAGTHANTEIFLRKRSTSKAGFVADATTEHIKVTADCLAYWEEVHSASGNQRVENRLRLECRHDGTNVPLIAQVGVAIA